MWDFRQRLMSVPLGPFRARGARPKIGYTLLQWRACSRLSPTSEPTGTLLVPVSLGKMEARLQKGHRKLHKIRLINPSTCFTVPLHGQAIPGGCCRNWIWLGWDRFQRGSFLIACLRYPTCLVSGVCRCRRTGLLVDILTL